MSTTIKQLKTYQLMVQSRSDTTKTLSSVMSVLLMNHENPLTNIVNGVPV